MYSIIVDFEATCWGNSQVTRTPEIIEIGTCRLDPFRRIESSFTRVIKPERHPLLSNYCKMLTGIEQEFVDRAKYFHQVLEEFLEWVEYDDTEPITLYTWGKTDETLLLQSCQYYRIETDWLGKVVDLKHQYARLKQLPKMVGLDRALTNEGFDFEGSRHRALPDAMNLCKLYVKYYEEFQR